MRLKKSYLFLFMIIFLAACSSNSVKQRKDWGKYFEENQIDGCFMLHDMSTGQFEIYNIGKVQYRYPPAGTFLIMDAMAGLETGVISDTNMTLKPDTSSAGGSQFSSNLTMAQAFRTTNIPWFQEVSRRIGQAKMEYWIDSVYYGNKVVGTQMDRFWLDNTLQISPDEQMGLLEKLYYSKLAFQPRSQRLVKSLMIKKQSYSDTLSYQTGFGKDKNDQIGWIIGWYKKTNKPFFFVLQTIAPDSLKDVQKKSFDILYKIFQDKEWLKNKQEKK